MEDDEFREWGRCVETMLSERGFIKTSDTGNIHFGAVSLPEGHTTLQISAWALYRIKDGRWVMVQCVTRTHIGQPNDQKLGGGGSGAMVP